SRGSAERRVDRRTGCGRAVDGVWPWRLRQGWCSGVRDTGRRARVGGVGAATPGTAVRRKNLRTLCRPRLAAVPIRLDTGVDVPCRGYRAGAGRGDYLRWTA